MRDGGLVHAVGLLLAAAGAVIAARGLPGGPLLALLGLAIAATLERSRAPFVAGASVLLGVVLDGLLLGLDLGAHDALPARLLRLARVAAVAIPLMAWLFHGLATTAEGRPARWGKLAFAVACPGLPLVLALSALVTIHAKWVLFVPADAAIIGTLSGAVLARRAGRWAEVLGFAAMATSMVAGLWIGGFAFDGPMPEPAGLVGYASEGRVLLRTVHIATILFGLAAVIAARIASPHPARDRRASADEEATLEKLNSGSIERSFVPEKDLDWSPAGMTSDADFRRLYDAWSLLRGTGADAGLSEQGRVAYAKYQQINLMLFTALLERFGIAAIARLHDLGGGARFDEYVGHFIKEETYHHTLFMRAIASIEATMPGLPKLPVARLELFFRWLYRVLGVLPHEQLRVCLSFTLFRWAERVTMDANAVAQKTLADSPSLVPEVWRFHAIDEARHIAFDTLLIGRMAPSWAMQRAVTWLVGATAVVVSLLLNSNEIWAARRLGLPLHLWHLPGLMRRTDAPFKRRVFSLIMGELSA